MPKQEVDYSKTVIYKIVCKDMNIKDVYVGHTTDFRKRKHSHKDRCCNIQKSGKHNYNVYQIIRENGGWDNWDMIEIEKYPCSDSNEARQRERYWYELNYCTMNEKHPGRSLKEFLCSNIENRRLKERTYYKNNKDLMHEKQKQHYEKYKEEIKLKSKEYRENNLATIKKRRQTPKQCECGCVVQIGDISKHRKTKKHIELMKLI